MVCAEDNLPGLVSHVPWVVVELMGYAKLVSLKHPMTTEARKGIKRHVQRVHEPGILIVSVSLEHSLLASLQAWDK